MINIKPNSAEAPSGLRQILTELYALDPSFRQYESRLKQIIAELLASRPEAKIDEEFIKGLRARLLAKAELISENKTNNNFMRKLNYIFGGVAVLAVAVVAVVIYQKQPLQTKLAIKGGQPLFSGKVQIEKLGSNAFGKLSENTVAATGKGGASATLSTGPGPAPAPLAESAPADNARSLTTAPEAGMAQLNATAMAPAPVTAPSQAAFGMGSPANSGFAGGADAKIMPPQSTYKYIYKGEELKDLPKQLDVYKRVKTFGDSGAGAGLLGQLNFGLLDASKFSNATIQNLSIAEDKDMGYVINVNVPEGNIYINENWQRWPHPEANCRDVACVKQYQIKPEQVPADGEIIKITNQFLADHNISLENYGQPQIQDYWRRELAAAADKSQIYIPDTINVVYPLKINGQLAYDESGNPAGLDVGVNVRLNKVSTVGELSVLKFQASGYEVETDAKKIIGVAEKGGNQGPVFYGLPRGEKQVTMELGTPILSLVKMWQYHDGVNDEILVPAYIFPVIATTDNEQYYPKSVVVPVAKEFLNRSEDGGPVRIMK